MSVQISVPPQYGYVLGLCTVGFPLLNQIQAAIVGKMRGPANVPYPNFYASPDHTKVSTEAYKFNCAQRVHGNFLEHMPTMMAMMLVAGLKYPMAVTGLGATWMMFRVLYAYGYITSQPGTKGKARSMGTPYLFAELGLLILSGMTAYGITTGGS